MFNSINQGILGLANKGRSVAADGLLLFAQHEAESGNPSTAVKAARDALAIFQRLGDERKEAMASFFVSHCLMLSDRPADARPYALRALEIASRLGLTEVEGAAAYILGIFSTFESDLKAGFEWFSRALSLASQSNDKNLQSSVLPNLAVISFNAARHNQAADFAERAIDVNTQLGYKSGVMMAYGVLGQVQMAQSFGKGAAESYEKGLAIAEAREEPALRAELLLLLSSALLVREHPDVERATECIAEAAELQRVVGEPRLQLNVLITIALLHLVKQEPQLTIAPLLSAIDIARQVPYANEHARALMQLGANYLHLGRLTEAEQTLREAMELRERIWELLRGDDLLKITTGETFESIYHYLLRTLIAEGKAEEAIEIAERHRARAFADLIRLRTGDVPAETPTYLSTAEIKDFAFRHQATIVEYTVLPETNEIWRASLTKLGIFVVRPSGSVHLCEVDLRPFWTRIQAALPDGSTPGIPIELQMRSLNWGLLAGSGPTEQLLTLWYDFLIRPVKQWLPGNNTDETVIFTPHEWIFQVPFPALHDGSGVPLAETHIVMTAPSIQVLSLVATRHRGLPVSPRQALVIGNPEMPVLPSGERLEPLPGSEHEARCVAEMLKVTPFIGKNATKARVFEEAPHCRILHFATHGLLEDLGSSQLPGAIALAPSGDDDGLLRSSEFSKLQLKADLVVLSACHTGYGRVAPDGVIGLSRALIAAGAASVIVALWAIPDAPTALLMQEFYKRYLSSGDKADALRCAMLELRKAHPDPFAWAAFTLIGERRESRLNLE